VRATFLDEAVLEALSVEEFQSRQPFPWLNVARLLRPDAFSTLVRDYPPLSLFFWDEGRPGQHYQRSQDRWFLEYMPQERARPGVARTEDLPDSWNAFIEELQTSAPYQAFVGRCLGRDEFVVRYNWHVGVTGSEVCPHLDKDSKVGTHIFYLNTTEDWDPAWGGATIVLGDRDPSVSKSDWEHFGTATTVKSLGNYSFFFKNGPQSWHGAPPLACPVGRHRRLFNVVFEHHPNSGREPPPLIRRLRRRAERLLRT
jgi:hypothetical protein